MMFFIFIFICVLIFIINTASLLLTLQYELVREGWTQPFARKREKITGTVILKAGLNLLVPRTLIFMVVHGRSWP